VAFSWSVPLRSSLALQAFLFSIGVSRGNVSLFLEGAQRTHKR
jgi:hypothetical protein